MKIRTSAPGELILFGEHAVVYGEPAIATAIDKRAYVTAELLDEKKISILDKNTGRLIEADFIESTHDPIIKAAQVSLDHLNSKKGVKLTIDSEIPVGVGLGSSAAAVTAASAAILNLLSDNVDLGAIAELSFEAEKTIHEKPSGITTAITTVGGTVFFKQGKVELLDVEPFSLVIGNTGMSVNTKELVEELQLRVEDPRVCYNLFTIGGLVKNAKGPLKKLNLGELGQLMTKNHGYLKDLGVSSENLELLVKVANDKGALGAKLTGAGGGGCMFAVAENPENLKEEFEKAGFEAFIAKTNQEGVRIEPIEEVQINLAETNQESEPVQSASVQSEPAKKPEQKPNDYDYL